MNEQIPNALERIENPILIILLAALMVAVVALWLHNLNMQRRLQEALIQNVQAMVNINATLAYINDRLERIEYGPDNNHE
jgi:sensor domain CHASE-containing protein